MLDLLELQGNYVLPDGILEHNMASTVYEYFSVQCSEHHTVFVSTLICITVTSNTHAHMYTYTYIVK